MDEALKISIGSIAFNMEMDAYKVLKDYLDSLQNHFVGNEAAKEIITDIEMRLSELLQMRLENPDRVVTLEDAMAVIKIMGNPRDFGQDESEDIEDKSSASKQTFTFRKKLYRDMNQRTIAGVCSGLSHYFKIDVTAIRAAFCLLFFGTFFSMASFSFFPAVLYFLLWIIMPKAVTMKDKLAMTGSNPSIEDIEVRDQLPNKNYKASLLGLIIKGILKFILIMIAISMALSVLIILGFFVWSILDTNLLYGTNYLTLIGMNTITLKAVTILALLIPIVCLLMLSIKLISGSQFTKGTMVKAMFLIVFWLGCSAYLTTVIGGFAYRVQKTNSTHIDNSIPTASDVLHIRLADEYETANRQPSYPYMLYRDNEKKKRSITILPPHIELKQDSTINDFEISMRVYAHGENKVKSLENLKNLEVKYTVTDSLVTLSPPWFGDMKPWRGERYNITVKIPTNKRVKLEGYLESLY